MGAHYGSIQVRSEDREAVKAAVEVAAKERKKKYLVGPVLKGWIAVYPEGSGLEEACAGTLAKQLNTILLHLIVHDDGVMFCNFYQNGKLLSEYSSDPDYFEEVSADEHERLKARPEVFRELAGSPETLAKISHLLGVTGEKPQFTFEQERLERLADLLGIQNALSSYEYLMSGERSGITGWKDFVHIPDLTAEKAAKKAAAASLRQEKLKLQKAGLLCNEWLPPCRKRFGLYSWADICKDPVNGGFLALWQRIGWENPPQLFQLQPPWPAKPPAVEHSFSSKAPEVPMLSPGGKWLAFYDGGLRLWNWSERRIISDIQLDAKPVAFSQDEELLFYQIGDGSRNVQKFFGFSLETMQVVRANETKHLSGDFMGIHPSNAFLVTRVRENMLGMIELESGAMKKILFLEEIKNPPHITTVRDILKEEGLLDVWGDVIARGFPKIMEIDFSPDGRMVFFATTIGLRVYLWTELLAADGRTPEPIFAVTPIPEALKLDVIHYGNFIYDLVLDEAQNRLLFSGIEGVIRFLNLKDGSNGVLVNPPGKSPMWQLELSHDRRFICCFCVAGVEERDEKLPRLQVWDYPALCKEAGLE